MTQTMRLMVGVSVAAVALSCGLFYAERAGATAVRVVNHPEQWPAGSSLALARRTDTVVAFVHPHCDCAQASLDDIRRMLKAHPRALAYVMFERPATMEEGWEVDSHWNRAAEIEGAVVLPDPEGQEAARFGAQPGDVMVYAADGSLAPVVPAGAVAQR